MNSTSNQADRQYNRIVKEIIKNGVWDTDYEVRPRWADGTPAHTKSIFGLQVEFDGSEVPILTSKKVNWEVALKEILLFWQKQTVREDDFKEANVGIWNEWFNNQGNLGRSYAYQFESHRHHDKEIIKVKPRVKKRHGELKPIIVGEKLKVNNLCNDELCGKIIDSKNSGKYIVLDVFSSDKDNNYLKMAKVQFLDTNYIRVTTKDNAKKGKVKDVYARRVKGVGYEGDVDSVKNYTKDEIKKLRNRWNAMIGRCYDKSNNKYSIYGGKGVFVDERWHSFENYLRDVKYLPQFILARENKFDNYQIDKDYYLSNCYSKDTCVWISAKDNVTYSYKPFMLIHPNGDEELFLSISDAERKYFIHDLSLILSNKSGRKSTKGFTAKYIDDNEHVYRYELSRNQVIELLHNIKHNPNSRRLMTNFWNYADVDKKELQECAYGTIFNIREGKLDLILTQRSVDVGLGLPFNLIQYYLLQCMIAHVSNLKVGRFIHQMGNVHIYDRHIESVAEQIEAELQTPPKLWINPNVKDFFDFTPSDIKLIDYKHGKFTPFEVAI